VGDFVLRVTLESRFTKHVVILDKLRTSDAHLLLAYVLSSAAYTKKRWD